MTRPVGAGGGASILYHHNIMICFQCDTTMSEQRSDGSVWGIYVLPPGKSHQNLIARLHPLILLPYIHVPMNEGSADGPTD